MKLSLHSIVVYVSFLACALIVATPAPAQAWREPVRGSWVRDGDPQPGDVDLSNCEIVVAEGEASPVQQAATFLAGDIEKLVGKKPAIVAKPSGGRVAVSLITGAGEQAHPGIRGQDLADKWEAYQIRTTDGGDSVSLVGSNPRGTAFAAYALAERIGIDPLYLWTGHEPARRERLVLKKTDHFVAPPTFKYRGMFHDDEDILPRPFEFSGFPLRIGDVPTAWYAKFFETALRLRMNMVAPYTRVHRRFEVQKLASDWGLFYTSHHYDILLSNPFGFNRFRLAERRGVSGTWDWLSNRENMLKYWRGGVEENGALDCIWPVGLRGTDDYAYRFPKDMPEAEQNKVFRDVIDAQIELARSGVPKEKSPPVFHFTLYGEMLDTYLGGGGKFDMPEDVILIWPDDNDGRMRAVPTERGKWKHGVYYHLAYWGPVAKQSMNVVPPTRVAGEFKRIVESGATEYMLLNVSEVREFVMGARMIAEICWDAPTSLADTPVTPMPDQLLA
ncbi:MAG: glycosyl hydrolase 115 family protein, partial [Tepidisphaeraceae bacterium]